MISKLPHPFPVLDLVHYFTLFIYRVRRDRFGSICDHTNRHVFGIKGACCCCSFWSSYLIEVHKINALSERKAK